MDPTRVNSIAEWERINRVTAPQQDYELKLSLYRWETLDYFHNMDLNGLRFDDLGVGLSASK